MKPKIAILASGEGTNFEALVKASHSGELQAQIVGLIVNRSGAGAVRRARSLGIPVAVLAKKDFSSGEGWDRAVALQLANWQVEWVALAGFLALIGHEVLKAYPQRIINTHPSLLPKFGGEGMHGLRVHQAVIDAKETVTGITFHLIDEVYDRGIVLKQVPVPVQSGDTAETLGERVRQVENQIYPRILNDLVSGRLTAG